LLLATVAAFVWANLAAEAYVVVWETPLAMRVGEVGLTLTLREWVNSGLMTFFFFVVGLEARREFDLGELRQRRRAALPVLAGLGGMIVPVVIFLALNAGRDSAAGWGVTMSTDTAFPWGCWRWWRVDSPIGSGSSCSRWSWWMISWPCW
jgi:Na+/H+ antiporter NhaA